MLIAVDDGRRVPSYRRNQPHRAELNVRARSLPFSRRPKRLARSPPATRSRWYAFTSGPTPAVSTKSGSPQCSAALSSSSIGRNRARQLSMTITRRLAVQRCPAISNVPAATRFGLLRGDRHRSTILAALLPPARAPSETSASRANRLVAQSPADSEPVIVTAATDGPHSSSLPASRSAPMQRVDETLRPARYVDGIRSGRRTRNQFPSRAGFQTTVLP